MASASAWSVCCCSTRWHRWRPGSGYRSAPWPSLIDAVRGHLLRHYDWEVEVDWIVWVPGMVAALNVACRAVGNQGDAVFTHTPVYPPFLSAPGLSSRRLVTDRLLRKESEGDPRWQFEPKTTDAALGAAESGLRWHRSR